jgi:hypothetical protein
VSTAQPLPSPQRCANYHRQNHGSLVLTPRQSGRVLTKAFRQLKKLGVFDPYDGGQADVRVGD